MTGRDTNLVVARLFEEIAQSLEVAGEQGHRCARTAGRRAVWPPPGAWRNSPPRVGARGAWHRFGHGGAHRRVPVDRAACGPTSGRLYEHPPGLAPLLRARGFGPASVQALHAATGVTSLDDVERAGGDGRLVQALGQRRSEELLSQLPALRNPILSLRLKSAWENAQLLLDLLGGVERIHVAGAARRMCETVVGGLDLVAPAAYGDTALLDHLERLPPVVNVAGVPPLR